MSANDPLVEIDDVSKHFGMTQGVVDTVLGREPMPVKAVDDVTLDIEKGDVMGIAGESGCGKTTLGKLLVKLYEPTSGTVRFDGADISSFNDRQEREFRKRVQMIFQDPFESLNPRMTVSQSVIEPMKINDIGDTYAERRQRATEVLNDVGLSPARGYLDEFPRELSGGERQRVAIARALVVDPDFIVCDEPVSMLDVSIRAGVLNLMKRLQNEYDLTYVFISHDLSLIRYMCDRTAIMYLGNVIEQGPTDDVINDPKHPYTEALFDAVPEVEDRAERRRANVTGEVPSPRNPPSGCRFHPRCPEIIPPDDWTGSQDAFRRAVQFQRRVTTRSLKLENVEADVQHDPRDRVVDAVLEHGLRLEVPEQHRAERETTTAVDLSVVDLPGDARQVLEEAAERVVDEDFEAASEALAGEFDSVCRTDPPDLRRVDSQDTACHLYGESPAGTGRPLASNPSD